MIDKETFAIEMGLLAGTYRYDADTPVLQSYYAALSPHLTTDQFIAACRAVQSSERFWPAPAVILEKAGVDLQGRAESAFHVVSDALSKHGGYRFLSADISTNWDAATWAGIKAIGGLREITECSEQRWPGLVKKFCKAYQESVLPSKAIAAGKPDAKVRQLVADTGRALALPPSDR